MGYFHGDEDEQFWNEFETKHNKENWEHDD